MEGGAAEEHADGPSGEASERHQQLPAPEAAGRQERGPAARPQEGSSHRPLHRPHPQQAAQAELGGQRSAEQRRQLQQHAREPIVFENERVRSQSAVEGAHPPQLDDEQLLAAGVPPKPAHARPEVLLGAAASGPTRLFKLGSSAELVQFRAPAAVAAIQLRQLRCSAKCSKQPRRLSVRFFAQQRSLAVAVFCFLFLG